MVRKSSLIVGVVVTILATAVGTAQTGTLRGAWRVVEATNADGQVNSQPEPGLYVFTDRHYSIMRVMAARGPYPEKPTDKDKVAAFDPFVANSGTYEIKGDQLTIRPMVAKNPNVMTGKGTTSTVKFEGKDVVLVTTGKATVKLQRIE
jgi:hypothetical protein